MYSLDVLLFLFGTSLLFHVHNIEHIANLGEKWIGKKIAFSYERHFNFFREFDVACLSSDETGRDLTITRHLLPCICLDAFPLRGFPGGSACKESACNVGDLGFHPWVWKIPWRREWLPTLYSYLENPMDRGAWRATVHGVTKNQTWLSD